MATDPDRPDLGRYDDAFFTDLADADRSAQRVLGHVLDLVQPTSVVDVGCGPGTWLRVLTTTHDCEVIGVDGSYVPPSHRQLPRDRFIEHDLAATLDLGQRFDLAMSLEVAEHLPASRAPGFVADLTRLAPIVLFSAAPPGQGGTNHVNEAWPSYWIHLFDQAGFRVHDVIRPRIWDDAEIAYCYRQNLLLFADDDLVSIPDPSPTSNPIVDLAHPELVHQLSGAAQEAPGTKALLRALPRALSASARSLIRGRSTP